jgi:hypothetical protein
MEQYFIEQETKLQSNDSERKGYQLASQLRNILLYDAIQLKIQPARAKESEG